MVSDLSPSGRATYVEGKSLNITKKYKVDPRGWINVKEFTEEELRDLLDEVISMRDELTGETKSLQLK